MSKELTTEISGFKVLGVTRSNFQRDFFGRGQGFPITVTKMDKKDPSDPDRFRAFTIHHPVVVEAGSEEDAARELRVKLEQEAIKGNL